MALRESHSVVREFLANIGSLERETAVSDSLWARRHRHPMARIRESKSPTNVRCRLQTAVPPPLDIRPYLGGKQKSKVQK